MLTVIDKATIGGAISAPSSMSDAEKERIRNFAKLVKARQEAQKQVEKIEEMIQLVGDKGMVKNLWVSQAGEVIPLFDIENSHLKNIYNWLTKNGRQVDKLIKKEYLSRFGELPESSENVDKYATADKMSRSRQAFVEEW